MTSSVYPWMDESACQIIFGINASFLQSFLKGSTVNVLSVSDRTYEDPSLEAGTKESNGSL